MKKRLLSLALALTMLLTSASAAFADVSDAKLSQTASVLSALGIMQGVGGDRFDPNSELTRAQFCKLAVTALGVDDVSAFRSYTIFPDVKSSHWAAPYINAAVRHAELKKLSIIRGYADGNFGPDKTVNFGEACTMLLRMLAYTEEDVGPFWPSDYIAKAKSLGLTDDVSVTDSKTAVKRADAAQMLLNTLGVKQKDGDLLLKKVASGVVENSILLATSETNSKLRAGEALFFENSDVQTRATIGSLDQSMVGLSGTVIFDKDNDSVAIGIVPNHNKVETVTVQSIGPDGIKTEKETIRPDRDTLLYTGETSTPKKLSEAWADVPAGSKLQLFYNSYGQLSLIAYLPTTTVSANANSFVYGLQTSANIPNNFTIVKNGVTIDRTGVKKYDVVTLDPTNKQALVSDTRLSGRYDKGEPTFSYPQRVNMFGTDYTISDNAAKTFADLKLDDYITLLFDAAGGVVAAYPKNTVSAEMQGVVTALKDKTATITLTNGLTIKPECEGDKLGDLMGRLVSVGQTTNGKAFLTRRSLSGKQSGDWSVSERKLGSNAVSPKVRVYEEVLSGAPLNLITTTDIDLTSVPSRDIRYTVSDTAGTITNIILGDVTGDSWIYGVGYSSSTPHTGEFNGKPYEYETYVVTIKYFDGSATISADYPVVSLPSGLNGNPVGVPKGYSKDVASSSFSTLPLTLVDTVELSDFDGTNGVRTKDGYYNVADNVGVYVSARKEFISLSNAKVNYKNFRLYANKTAENGGKIRMIIAN